MTSGSPCMKPMGALRQALFYEEFGKASEFFPSRDSCSRMCCTTVLQSLLPQPGAPVIQYRVGSGGYSSRGTMPKGKWPAAATSAGTGGDARACPGTCPQTSSLPQSSILGTRPRTRSSARAALPAGREDEKSHGRKLTKQSALAMAAVLLCLACTPALCRLTRPW